MMFMFDKTKPDPKPARLKYTYYDGMIHGSVTGPDANNDEGEYRVLLKNSMDV